MLKVLLVEDSDTDALIIQRAIKDHLKDAEYSRTSTLTEADTLLQRQEDTTDIVLLDLGLPDTASPADTYSKMKKWAGKIPIVIMTNLNDHDLARLLVHDGAEDYLSKDLMVNDPEHVCDAIDFAMERHAMYRKVASEKETAQQESRQKDSLLNCFMGGYSVSK